MLTCFSWVSLPLSAGNHVTAIWIADVVSQAISYVSFKQFSDSLNTSPYHRSLISLTLVGF